MKKFILASVFTWMLSIQPCMAQLSSGNQPAPSSTVKGGVAIPSPSGPIPDTALGLIQQAQSPTLSAIFCGDTGSYTWMLELNNSPTEFVPIHYGTGDDPSSTWTTYVVKNYDWIDAYAQGEIDFDQLTTLINDNLSAKLLIGSLQGPCGSATMTALYLSWKDDQNITQHGLIPVFESPPAVYEAIDILLDESSGAIATLVETEDCDVCDPGCCHQRYRVRISDALNDYNGEVAENVKPIGLAAGACFVLCAKWAWASPAVTAGCILGCTTGVAVGGVINKNTASNDLNFKKETAQQSYCLCIEYKETHCAFPEIDLVGCEDPTDE